MDIKKISIILFLVGFTGFVGAKTKVNNLRCEFSNQPLGLVTDSLRFTWNYSGNEPFLQHAYRIQIASTPQQLKNNSSDVYLSGKQISNRSYASVYLPGLKPKSRYFWRIIAWNQATNDSVVSAISTFETGIKQWKAIWITDEHDKDYKPSAMFRKVFDISTKNEIAYARMYIAAGGYYQMQINELKVGDQVLDPAYTHFDKRILYNSFDITALLKSGKNCVSVVLGNGWYNIQSLAVWNFDLARWRNRPRFIAEFEIVYRNGKRETFGTDHTWQTNTGPYLFNNLYSGDMYDARQELEGWRTSAYNAVNWKSAKEVTSPAPIVEPQQMPSIRAVNFVLPQKVTKINDHISVVDFGVNFTGFCKLELKAPAGTKITLKYAENIDENGRIDQRFINKYFHKAGPLVKRPDGDNPVFDSTEVFQMDTYFCKGTKSAEVFVPQFTYHGFRYVEVESSELLQLTKENIKGLFVHTDVRRVGNFECSNPDLNKLYKATMQSYLSNLHSIPTDCPQREKNGWTADAYISIDLALQNFYGLLVYEKWMRDFIDNQNDEGRISGIVPSAGWGYIDWIGPTWDVAMFVIPDALYRYYGETKSIAQIYPTLEKYLSYLKTREKNGLITYGIGDWVPTATKTPTDFTSACSYFYMYKLMAKFAAILGKDYTTYQLKASEIRSLINEKYLDTKDMRYVNGSQTSYAYPLYIGVVPDSLRGKIALKLNNEIIANNYRIDFGMLGSKYVSRVLSEFGYQQTVERMLLNSGEPSWLAWIKDGLTTLPEWFQKDEYAKASYNHVFLGDISAWMVQNFGGINQESNQIGFQYPVIRPYFTKELSWVRASYETTNGILGVFWNRKGNLMTLIVDLPQNCKTKVFADKEYLLGPGKHTIKWIEK